MAPATDTPQSAITPGTSDTDNKPHRRPRHQIKRSLSELAAPVRLPRHDKDQRDRSREPQQQQQQQSPNERQHRTHRNTHQHDHHGNSHHYHHSSRKDRDDGGSSGGGRLGLANQLLPIPNSASGHHFFGRASADMPRSERSSSYFGSDLDRSRRTSLVTVAALAGPGLMELAKMPGMGVAADRQRRSAKDLTPAENEAILRKERADAISRADALRSSLAELNAFSNHTTKTLDDSYYSVLERLGTLQQTIIALRELASLSHDLAQSFKHDSTELVEETNSQLQPFSKLDEQEDRIAALQARIGVGHDKTNTLTERVDRVRERIEGWEAADHEWQTRTRKRLKVVWAVIVTAVVAILILAVLGAHHDKLISAETTAAAVDKASALSSGIRSAGHSLYSSNLPGPTMLRPGKVGSGGDGSVGPDTLGEALGTESRADSQHGENGARSLIDEVREAMRAGHQDADWRDQNVLRALDEL